MNQALIALGILVTALTPTIAVITTHVLARSDRHQKAEVASDERATAKERMAEIHILVNDRLDEALERIRELEKAYGLTAGQPIPPSGA